jgi:hypothetical protein
VGQIGPKVSSQFLVLSAHFFDLDPLNDCGSICSGVALSDTFTIMAMFLSRIGSAKNKSRDGYRGFGGILSCLYCPGDWLRFCVCAASANQKRPHRSKPVNPVIEVIES